MDVLDKDQALAIMGFTGITTCPFDWFHEDVERRMGRGVWTHEMANAWSPTQVEDAIRSARLFLGRIEEAVQRNDTKGGV